jgi:hypothetical protein
MEVSPINQTRLRKDGMEDKDWGIITFRNKGKEQSLPQTLRPLEMIMRPNTEISAIEEGTKIYTKSIENLFNEISRNFPKSMERNVYLSIGSI